MTTLITVVYVFVCIFLIFVILLQSGRGGGLGGIGGGTGQQVFGGGGGSNILTRLTSISAALFMLLSVALAYLSSRDESALERVESRIQESGAGAVEEGGDEPAPAETEAPQPLPTVGGAAGSDDSAPAEGGARDADESAADESAADEPTGGREAGGAEPESEGANETK